MLVEKVTVTCFENDCTCEKQNDDYKHMYLENDCYKNDKRSLVV